MNLEKEPSKPSEMVIEAKKVIEADYSKDQAFVDELIKQYKENNQ